MVASQLPEMKECAPRRVRSSLISTAMLIRQLSGSFIWRLGLTDQTWLGWVGQTLRRHRTALAVTRWQPPRAALYTCCSETTEQSTSLAAIWLFARPYSSRWEA